MVYIALRAVKEYAFCIIKNFFNILAQKSRPVCRNLTSADNVRVICKVNINDSICALTVEAKYVDAFIGIADRTYNIGVINTGICFYRAVLHNVAANECNIGGATLAISHFCILEVSYRKLCYVCNSFSYKVCIFLDKCILRIFFKCGTCMCMCLRYYDVFHRNACSITCTLSVITAKILFNSAMVYAYEKSLFLSALKCESVCLQVIKNTFCKTWLIVTPDRNTHRRVNVYTCKTCFKLVHFKYLQFLI